MEIIEIQASDVIGLRNRLLRPDLDLAQCHYPGDSDSSTYHLGCYADGELIGIVSIYKRSNEVLLGDKGYQIRAMATTKAARGKGVGSKLLKAAEVIAFNLKADYVWANARAAAIGFYEKAGYTIINDEFQIESIGAHYLIYQTSA